MILSYVQLVAGGLHSYLVLRIIHARHLLHFAIETDDLLHHTITSACSSYLLRFCLYSYYSSCSHTVRDSKDDEGKGQSKLFPLSPRDNLMN